MHGRTAAQIYYGFVGLGPDRPRRATSGDSGVRQRRLRRAVAARRSCCDSRCRGVLVGRGALRNPWIFEQAAALARGEAPREITLEERGRFLLDYIDLLLHERTGEAEGFRHVAPPGPDAGGVRPATPRAATIAG